MHTKIGMQTSMFVPYREARNRGNAPTMIPEWPHPVPTQLGIHSSDELGTHTPSFTILTPI